MPAVLVCAVQPAQQQFRCVLSPRKRRTMPAVLVCAVRTMQHHACSQVRCVPSLRRRGLCRPASPSGIAHGGSRSGVCHPLARGGLCRPVSPVGSRATAMSVAPGVSASRGVGDQASARPSKEEAEASRLPPRPEVAPPLVDRDQVCAIPSQEEECADRSSQWVVVFLAYQCLARTLSRILRLLALSVIRRVPSPRKRRTVPAVFPRQL